MSGVSAANLLMKIMEFDWLPFAKRDVRHAVEELHRSQPILFNQQVCDKILGLVEPFLEQNLQTTTTTTRNSNTTTTKQQQQQQLEPELFPPGQCIHFYRDGIGVSVNVVPNTFFGELDFNRRMLDGMYILRVRVLFLLSFSNDAIGIGCSSLSSLNSWPWCCSLRSGCY